MSDDPTDDPTDHGAPHDTDDDRFAEVGDHGGIAGLTPEFVDVAGTRTRYYDVGDGPALVLIHGGGWSGTSSANTWSTVLGRLSGKFRVIAFDRIGCGMTDNPEDVEDYRYGSEIEHTVAFLDAVGVERAHLCGASRGAGLAACVAVESPDLARTLVLTNSHTFGPPAGDFEHRYERLFGRNGTSLEETDPEYTRFRYEQYCHRTEHVTEAFCTASAYMASRPKARETAEVLRECEERFEASKEARIREVHERIRDGVLTVPTLYAFGRNDMTVPLETAIAAFDLLGRENPDVRLELFNDCGHLPYREHPEAFARTVGDFVDRCH
ncbi:MAG: alpha/beta hydrolase [Haloarculaceae archaeon]